MTRSSPGVAQQRVGLPGAPGRLPPEERFWKRYSPHHEFPLSSVTSVALHVLVLVLLVVTAWVAVKLGVGEGSRPLPVTAVRVAGGDGGAKGDHTGPGNGDAANLAEDKGTPPEAGKPAAGVNLPDLNPGDASPLPLPKFNDKDGLPRRPPTGPALKELDALERAAHEQLLRGLGGPGGGGPGGKGDGPPGPGTGKGKLTQRQQRLLRWSMTFNTESGEDYLRQLRGIRPGGGAILAVPAGEKRYRVFRDLTRRPPTGEVEDLARLGRIYWVDDRPESVAGLARALGIPAPPAFIALFPQELEEHLAGLEKVRLQQDFPGRTEEDIGETRFVAVPAGDGYEARVVSVSLKR
jgi:hypothetical protein